MFHQREETINVDLAFEEYKSKYYKQLREHKVKVKFSETTFRCPYCCESREYTYKDLCKHASRIVRESRSAGLKEKAKHMALEEYLERDFDASYKESESSSRNTDLEENSDIMRDYKKEESVVWPPMAVVANIPVDYEGDSYLDDGFLGDSAKNLKDEWIKQGYKPVRVYPLWSLLGHSGFALVKFGKERDGFNNAKMFVKDFEVGKHGRKDWYDSNRCKDDKLYAWIARDEDYYVNGLVGDFLRKNGVLKTVSAIEKENEVKKPELLLGLETLLEEMSNRSKEIQSQVSTTNSHMASVMKQNDMLIENFNKDLKKTQEKANKIFEHLQIKLQHEDHEKKKNELAMSEHTKAYDRLLKLAYDEKRDNESLHNQIIELQKKIDDKELEINEMELMKNLTDENVEAKKKIESIQNDLKVKEKEMEDLKGLNQALIVKEKLSNDELEDARKALISGMSELFCPPPANIAVKRKMDELDVESFTVAAKKRCSRSQTKVKDVIKFFSLWEDCMRDPNWHPIKMTFSGKNCQEVLSKEEEKIESLRAECGEDVFTVFLGTLVHEYDASVRHSMTDLWHKGKDRKATLKEAVEFILKQLKTEKKKKEMKLMTKMT